MPDNRFIITFIITVIIIFPLYSQRIIKGIITDSETKEPLAFANVQFNEQLGSVTDIDGNFSIIIPNNAGSLHISYIGYKTYELLLDRDTSFYRIALIPETEDLETVIISAKGINPAIPLMKEVIRNKSKNDYRKIIRNYQLTRYYRFLVSAETDSIETIPDSIFIKGRLHNIDSSGYKMKRFLKDKDIYLMETVEEVIQNDFREKHKVLGHKIAGLKNPLYEILSLQMKSYNIYDDNYHFFIKDYIGPLSKLSFKQYRYRIEDTLNYKGREVINVAYRNTRKPLISGNLFIIPDTKAVAFMTLNTNENFVLNSQHYFEYYPEHKVWIPSYNHSLIKKNKNKNDFDLDGVISFKTRREADSISHSHKQNLSNYFFTEITNKFSGITFNPPKTHNTYDLLVVPNATKRKDTFWANFRDSLMMHRAINTYRFNDSSFQKNNMEQKLHKVKRIFNGSVPMGKIDWKYINFITLNQYEKLRLTLDFHTNPEFSNKLTLQAYTGYGFGDRNFKYGGSATYKLNHDKQMYLTGYYHKDIKHAGVSSTSHSTTDIIDNYLSRYALTRFFDEKSYGLNFEFLPTPKWKLEWKLSQSWYHDIQNLSTGLDKPIWNLGIKTDFQPFSKFYLSNNKRELLENGYPKIFLDYQHYIPVDTKNHSFFTIHSHIDWEKEWYPKWRLFLSGNYTYTSEYTPYWQQAVLPSNDLSNGIPWYKSILPSSGKAFETVYDGEFIASSIAGFKMRQNVRDIHISQSFRPELSWVLQAAWGFPEKTDITSHYGFQKGLWETGIEIDNLLNINFLRFGLGAYYRLGYYAHPDKADNFSLRIRLSLGKLSF